MQRVEAGCRGFALTGDDSYLDTCRVGKLAVEQIEAVRAETLLDVAGGISVDDLDEMEAESNA